MKDYKKQSGVALVITLIIMGIALAILLILAQIFLNEIILSNNLNRSTVSILVADGGVERLLYETRRDDSVTISPGDSFNSYCSSYFDWTGFSASDLDCNCEVTCDGNEKVLSCTGTFINTSRILEARHESNDCS